MPKPASPRPPLRAAAFLDRDGVLNTNPRPRGAFVTRPEQLRLRPGVGEGIALLAGADFFTCLVTNQPIVGEGDMTMAELDAVHERLAVLLGEQGARIDAVYTATETKGPRADWQKPGAGMLRQAAADHGLDLTRSVIFGDKDKDLKAGQKVGAQAVFVSGDAYDGECERCRTLTPYAEGATLLDAARAFLDRLGRESGR